jgi:S-adenosylmethionine-diacylgycerolhomoserine-N-methlytransferase
LSETPNIDEDAGARMDRLYRHQRRIYDASRRVALLGRKRLIERLDAPAGAHVLEIGCGTAWNLVAAARRYPEVIFCGVDISQEMLKTAERKVARSGLARHITLARGDATHLDAEALFGRASFDRVLMSYTLSMIPDWRGVIEQAARVVAPGGSMHIVDFGEMERYPTPVRNAMDTWLAVFTVFPRRDLEIELSALAGRHGFSMTFERLYGGYAQHAILRRPQ